MYSAGTAPFRYAELPAGVWLVLHPKVYSDIDEIIGHYERLATSGLGEEFYTELCYFVTLLSDKPQSFTIRKRVIRKANLRRFIVTLCSAALAAQSEFSSSATTIRIHLVVPDVDRSMAEFEECRLVVSDFNRDIGRWGS